MTTLGPAGAERATYDSGFDHRDFHGICPYIHILDQDELVAVD
jgi:hypothetical protein